MSKEKTPEIKESIEEAPQEKVNVAEQDDKMKDLIATFVLRQNYWGYLFSTIRRRAMTGFGSIMAVAPEKNGTLSLLYDPVMVSNTSSDVILKIIEHEGMHVLNKHIPRFLKIVSEEPVQTVKNIKMSAFNKAADCCVNTQADIPKDLMINGKIWKLCIPERFGLPNGRITEEYYVELLKQEVENFKNGSGRCGECDSCKKNDGSPCENAEDGTGGHKFWSEFTKDVTDVNSMARKIDQYIQNVIKESAKVFNKNRGNLPSHIAELIQSALDPPKVPYYQLIAKLIKANRLSKFKRSLTKVNRKRTWMFDTESGIPDISPFPGKTRDRTYNIVVEIDTSGSMSIDDIAEGLSGVKNIIENDRYCFTTVLECDCGVEKEYNVSKIRDIQFDVRGRGGTTLAPGLFRAKELNCDVCLVFTDGYIDNINAIDRSLLPRKIIWVITEDGNVDNLNQTGVVVRL